ncbi:MAG TPA: endonuclease domain-containing protein [Bacteroidia bacterium]|nr:endonuclease domain-containing protein [Bacteroidia bacterium]
MKPIDRSFFFNASPEIFERAKLLRQNATEAEKTLWKRLCKNQLHGFRFRQQHPIGKFIADFYCTNANLIIELDGEIHLKEDTNERDAGRQYELERLGLTVLRFTNKEVLENIESVIERIKLHLQ